MGKELKWLLKKGEEYFQEPSLSKIGPPHWKAGPPYLKVGPPKYSKIQTWDLLRNNEQNRSKTVQQE